MADLYSRDELAEPLRQLGFVMAWVIENRFLPDSTRSGAWQTPAHENMSTPRSEPRAGQYLGALCRGTNQLPETSVQKAIENLGTPTDVVEPESENEEDDEAEDEDDERDALQERAAEVAVDSTCMPPEINLETDEAPTSTLFAPPMPKLEFTVIRHLFRGTRHWCVKGAHII